MEPDVLLCVCSPRLGLWGFMYSVADKARACRDLADEIRMAAEALKDDAQRGSLLRTALSYERMAVRLETACLDDVAASARPSFDESLTRQHRY